MQACYLFFFFVCVWGACSNGSKLAAIHKKRCDHKKGRWYTVAGTAKKKGNPYTIIEMDCKMKDFGGCCDYYMKGNRASIRWTDLKCLKVNKAHPASVFVKYSLAANDFKEIQFAGNVKVGSDVEDVDSEIDSEIDLERPCDRVPDRNKQVQLPDLGQQTMVTVAKKKDLVWMCDELIIPTAYHSFYKSLAVTETEQLSVEMDEAEKVSSVISPAERRNVQIAPKSRQKRKLVIDSNSCENTNGAKKRRLSARLQNSE
jgi:hypothetical protein